MKVRGRQREIKHITWRDTWLSWWVFSDFLWFLWSCRWCSCEVGTCLFSLSHLFSVWPASVSGSVHRKVLFLLVFRARCGVSAESEQVWGALLFTRNTVFLQRLFIGNRTTTATREEETWIKLAANSLFTPGLVSLSLLLLSQSLFVKSDLKVLMSWLHSGLVWVL